MKWVEPYEQRHQPIRCEPQQLNGTLATTYTRAFQLKSTAGRTPVSQVLKRAAWSKIRRVL